MTEVDLAFLKVQAGNPEAYPVWMHLVEIPLFQSLRSFARSVDVESIVQEALMRMWVLAPRLQLAGPDASLRYVIRLARNVAISEARRLRTMSALEVQEIERLSSGHVPPDPAPDPGLRRLIDACIATLPRQPRKAILRRIQRGHLPDRQLARELRMAPNTFLQNVVRARKLLRECLRRHGVRLEEHLA